jgi:hypothetical protein
MPKTMEIGLIGNSYFSRVISEQVPKAMGC